MNGKGEEQNNYLPLMNGASQSFWQASWMRLKKNKGAMAGLVMVVLAILIAVFGYFLAPDPSPFANRIILEIGGEKPGYTQNFLLVKKMEPQSEGLLSGIFSGKRDQFDYIPIVSYQQTGDSIVAEKYIDEGFTEPIVYNKKSLAEQPVKTKQFVLGTD